MVWHGTWTNVKTVRRTFAVGYTLLLLLVVLVTVPPAAAQPNVTGQWSVLPYTMPINPIHVGLMKTGRILIVSGTQNDPTVTTDSAAVYDPNTGAINVQTIPWDLFCNGLSWMSDGRALIAGGNLQYNPFRGIRTATMFDPSTERFIQVQDMARGRWYPSVVALADGRMATFSGWLEGGGTNNAVEIYTTPDGWSPEFTAPFIPELYPWLHVLPNGRVFMSGANVSSSIFDPGSSTWATGVATMNYPRPRIYGSSVLLPLSAADGWRARVMIMGGDNPATDSVEIIDLSQPNPSWRTIASMSGPRIQMDAVILPTGKILALGGSALDKTGSTATLNADLFDPASETWTPAGTMNMPRLYHSVALLLPDGTVWSAGSNPSQGTWENRMEIYRPAYLFDSNGGPASRPSITGAPSIIGYGGSFQVNTPNAAGIASVVLIRNGANTHAFDMDQRMLSLSFTKGAGALTVTAPPNANVAPPGYYMLFIVDNNGVPSVAPFVQISSNPSNQPPRGSIDLPAGDVTISAGQSVNFVGSGGDADGAVAAYRWIFPGGSPATSTSATPGSVTFNTPGTYYVSLTVTDNQGTTDPSPPVRIVNVQSATLTTAFTSPADGATVNGNVTVGMSASGASGFSNTFTLSLDGTQIFSNTTSSTTQSFTWNSTTVPDGVHTLGLTVRDANGATATATRNVTVNNNAPPGTLQVTFPNVTPGQSVQGTLPVQIAVANTRGSNNRFTVLLDGVQQTVIASNATTVTWNWDTTTAANGSRTISVSVQDATGNTGTGFVYVQVANSGTTLKLFITQPTAGTTVSGTAWATLWLEGSSASSKTYSLTLGGQPVGSSTTASNGPVSVGFNTTVVVDGTQPLVATVTDSSNATGSATVNVNVSNGITTAPTPTPTPTPTPAPTPAPTPTPTGTLLVAITQPTAGTTVSGTAWATLWLEGSTASSKTYSLSLGGQSVGSSTTASNGPVSVAFNTNVVVDGTQPLVATVTDSSNATGSATVNVNVSNGITTAPAPTPAPTPTPTPTPTPAPTPAPTPTPTGTLLVAITQPTVGTTVSGTEWVTIWVDGAAGGNKAYTMTANGTTVWTETTGDRPATLPWVTTNGSNGTQTLTATVRDSAGATGTGTITVTVANP